MNGNWVTTFVNAVKKTVQAIVASPVGQQVCLDITDKPGGNDKVQGQFCFTNPGIAVGPDVIAQKIIMGNGGLIYYMVKRTGETDAHASVTANNNAAQKVFALMVDHAAYDSTPPPPPMSVAAPMPPAVSNVQPLPAQTSAPTQNSSQSVPVIAQTRKGSPVVAPNDTNALIAQLMAQGATQQQALAAALASLQHQGVDTSQPQVQQQLQAAVNPGMSNTTLIIIGAVAIGAALFLKK